jgi:acyl homoserine lactone synthase
MPYIVAGRLTDLPSEIRHGLGRFRYDVFVRRLGWVLPDIQENTHVEWDRFDGGNTIQVIALTSAQQICGCARLMSTTGPYLLRELLSRTSALEAPAMSTVWELSRFAASRIHGPLASATSGISLFPYPLAIAASAGATRIIGMLTPAVARLYRRFGLELQSIGAAHDRSASPFLVCAIDLTPVTFAKLGCEPGDLLNAVRWFGSRPSTAPDEVGAGTGTSSLPGKSPTSASE